MENTQGKKVLEHLQVFGSITPMDAFHTYQITRLAAVVFDLRKQGHEITTENMRKGNVSWAVYRLKYPKQTSLF